MKNPLFPPCILGNIEYCSHMHCREWELQVYTAYSKPLHHIQEHESYHEVWDLHPRHPPSQDRCCTSLDKKLTYSWGLVLSLFNDFRNPTVSLAPIGWGALETLVGDSLVRHQSLLPNDSKRKHNGLCTDSGCKVRRQQKTRHWTCSQRECQCVSAPQQSSKLYHSALDPLVCHILMNTQRDCHCMPCLRNWPSRVSCVPVCPSLMMQLLCLHHNDAHPPSTTWQDWWMQCKIWEALGPSKNSHHEGHFI